MISISDEEELFTTILQSTLPDLWRGMSAYPALQQIGSEWYNTRQSLCLKVPSAVVPKEYNYVINTNHPQFIEKISLVRTEGYFWDERLL